MSRRGLQWSAATAVLIMGLAGVPSSTASAPRLGDRQAPVGQEGDSRAEDLVDSRQVVFEATTVIRQDDTPAIDTRRQPGQEVVSLRTDVLFEFGSATLTPQANAVIDEAVRQIDQLDPARLIITGHTDSVGSDASNQTLSEARAAAVDTAIRDRMGSDAPATEIGGRGESEPVAPNALPDGTDNPAGRALNRRVEVEVISR